MYCDFYCDFFASVRAELAAGCAEDDACPEARSANDARHGYVPTGSSLDMGVCWRQGNLLPAAASAGIVLWRPRSLRVVLDLCCAREQAAGVRSRCRRPGSAGPHPPPCASLCCWRFVVAFWDTASAAADCARLKRWHSFAVWLAPERRCLWQTLREELHAEDSGVAPTLATAAPNPDGSPVNFDCYEST
eukprot:2130601-Rhodomonas_salina.2